MIKKSNNVRYIFLFFTPILSAAALFIAAVIPLFNKPAAEQAAQWVVRSYQHKLSVGRLMGPNKLVILGGSGVYFGVRADLISEATGVKTLNFGTHADLPFTFQSHMVKKILSPGDTVVLALEYKYYGFFRKSIEKPEDVLQNSLVGSVFLSISPEYVFSLGARSFMQLIRNISPQYIMDGWKILLGGEPPPVGLGYRTDKLNAFGDEDHDYHENANPRAVLDIRMEQARDRGLPYVEPNGGHFDYIKDFIDWCNKNKVKIYATWPNSINESPYNGYLFEEIQRDIQNFYRETNVSFLGNIDQALLPIDMMLDTDLHPTLEGARIRSQKLAETLCHEAKICKDR